MHTAPLAILGLVYVSVVTGMTLQRRAVDFFDPAQGGGSMFDNATYGGEPLNVSSPPGPERCPVAHRVDWQSPASTGDHLGAELS